MIRAKPQTSIKARSPWIRVRIASSVLPFARSGARRTRVKDLTPPSSNARETKSELERAKRPYCSTPQSLIIHGVRTARNRALAKKFPVCQS
jgi:hypothetical protein